MSRDFQGGAIYSDLRVTGERVSCVPNQTIKTHGADIAFPPSEPWGFLFLCQTTRGPWKFAGKSHWTGDVWEYVGGLWLHHGPSNGTNGFVYTLDGQLHIIAPGPNVTSQGYRRNADGSIVGGDATYGPFHGLSEYSDLGDGLFIGQGDPQHGTPTGVILWDGTHNRLLQAGLATFIRVDRDGDAVAITFSTPSGAVFLQTTMAELRALPVVPTTAPMPIPLPPPLPIPPKPVPVPPKPPAPTPKPVPPIVVKPRNFGDFLMLSTFSDPNNKLLVIKAVKPLSGEVSVLENLDGRIVSIQPDGSVQDRDAGANGGYEKCRVQGSVATWQPTAGKFFTFGFVIGEGL